MSSTRRIVVVTLGLAAAAAVAGGIVGVAMLLAWSLLWGGLHLEGLGFLLYGGVVGGAVGAVLGPTAAWLLMRHVPLGKAIGSTALGTIAGSVAGLLLGGPGASFYGAFLGFGASAVAVRALTPKDTRLLAPADPAA